MALYKINENGCWEWQRGTYYNGYGIYKRGYAHRYFYEESKGKIGEKMVLHHKCRNRKCVNPEHLEPLTRREHMKVHEREREYCGDGHKYTPENTRYNKRGNRVCRTCHREDNRRLAFIKNTIPRIERKKAVRKEFLEGKDRQEIAEKYGISIRSVYRYGSPLEAWQHSEVNNWY